MAFEPQQFEIESIAHHRNGIGGYPFHVGILTDDDGSRKVFIHFEETEREREELGMPNPRTAILDIALLSKGVVKFGVNSWRGDLYTEGIKEHIKIKGSD